MSLAGACSESVHEGLLGDGSRCILTGGLNVVLLVAPPGYILSVGECSGKELAIVCVEGQPESLPLPHPSLVSFITFSGKNWGNRTCRRNSATGTCAFACTG